MPSVITDNSRLSRAAQQLLVFTFLIGAFLFLPAKADAAACGSEIYAALRSPDIKTVQPIQIHCDIALSKSDVVRQRLYFNGSQSSGVTFDCGGATIDGTLRDALTIAIVSQQRPDHSWDAPKGVTIKNCTIKGDLRVQGLTANAQGDWLRQSSVQKGHTERAQADAPSDITLSNIDFISTGRIPLYVGIGTTGLTLLNSHFYGKLAGTAIYMEAESGMNKILDNTFDIQSNREDIAVDGSAKNIIANNTFINARNGGIFLYRNCGENGIIRHQPPQGNLIFDNTFKYAQGTRPEPSIWLNSRNGNSPVCSKDPKYPFGSSLSNLDFAKFNIVSGNRLIGNVDIKSMIKNDDSSNNVHDNIVSPH
ncbi:right-handed parallel beta-helix repeat-containing protein [Rhizobium lusitanum]|uniref:Right-handed parallel beta-helix repeat-containing protein n=1 Tax=Rhizobium lusitanum TaxID=293958 RepID=A0A6L9U983_9HYPH|nr:right-handed parallel beta-helix repeat-containing protein [Rhizobium lusitanum]NEI71969.1 right-handed parallel beta-helix repeat-containing protein [Rhizobium lusitanum]